MGLTMILLLFRTRKPQRSGHTGSLLEKQRRWVKSARPVTSKLSNLGW